MDSIRSKSPSRSPVRDLGNGSGSPRNKPAEKAELQTEANIPIADGVSEKSDNNRGMKHSCKFEYRNQITAEKKYNLAKRVDFDEPVQKKQVVEELMSLNQMVKEHEGLCLKRISLEHSDAVKEIIKKSLEEWGMVMAGYARSVILDASEEENIVKLFEEVKGTKRIMQQRIFEEKKALRKLRRSRRKMGRRNEMQEEEEEDTYLCKS